MENSTKTRWFYLISGLLITANIAVLAILFIHRGGHEGRNGGPEQHGSMFEYLTNELQLTKLQQDAYDSLRNEHHAAATKLQDSIRAAKDALFNLLQQANTGEDMVTAASNKAAALNAQLDVLTFHHFQKLRAICTPEQQKKFDSVIQEAIRGMGRQQGPPPGGPGGPGGPPPGPR